MTKEFDAVVIGSGTGGLTCGAFLARAGMKVLVLEKHTKIGGYTHHFKRKDYTFESGVHSVPMADGGTIRHLLKLLGIEQSVETIALSEMFHVETPDYSFTMPSMKEEILDTLKSSFPHEKENIKNLFADFKEFNNKIILPVFDFENNFREEDKQFVSKYHNLSFGNYIAGFLKDDNCKNAFYSQWPYGGASPFYGSSLFYTIMFLLHYYEGTHCVKGGFSVLAEALANAITSRGGTVKRGRNVVKVTAENDIVKSVITSTGEEYTANLFVSNISPYILHSELLDKRFRHRLTLRRLNKLKPSVSAVIVYLGMKPQFADLFNHNTYFWFSSTDYCTIYNNIMQNRKDEIDHLILLNPPLNGQQPTLTLINFCHQSYSKDWHSDKMRIADKMVEKAESLFPGIKENIVLSEVGSPATLERFTANSEGAFYGFENTKDMYGEAKLPIRTHLKNLFQTGHWGKPGGGIHNVMNNGYTTYHTIMQSNSSGNNKIFIAPKEGYKEGIYA